jgi:hypothetical protein
MSEPIKTNQVDPTPPIEPTRNDPTPERRVGDARFLPVVIAAGVAIVVILIAAVLILHGKNKEVVPAKGPHPATSQIAMPCDRFVA